MEERVYDTVNIGTARTNRSKRKSETAGAERRRFDEQGQTAGAGACSALERYGN